MQTTGSLRKRKRRNLAKVNGLGTIPYDELQDVFTGRELFGKGASSSAKAQDFWVPKFSTRSGQDTRLRFSSKEMLDYRRAAGAMLSARSRITRDPTFHNPDNDIEGDMEEVRVALEEWDTPGGDEFVGLGPFDKRREVDDSIKGRPHFLDKYAMQRLKQLLYLGVASGSFPWKWNARETQIDLWSPLLQKLWTLLSVFLMAQTIGISIFQVYSFFCSFDENTKTYRKVFMGSFSMLWYLWAVFFTLNLYLFKNQTRLYINTMLMFNKKYVEKYLIHLEEYSDGGRWIINFAIISNITQVFVSVSLFLMMPYQPWYLFSFVYPKPWYWLIPGAIQEFVVVGQVITSYMLLSWVVVAHCNTMQFWLREIHNHNDSDYTIDELRSPRNSLETYKALLVLNQVFNAAVAPMGIPMVKICMSTAMIPCGYVLIRSMNHIFVEELPGILTYPLGVLDCATAGFVIMSMAAEVFDLGCSFIDSWSRTKQKDFRRVLMSCPSMKIWVGRFYFLTVSTTIAFFKVIFDYITHCIITFP